MISLLDRHLVVLALILLGTSVVFTWTGETRPALCTMIYIVEVLALDQTVVELSSAARKRTYAVDRLLIACFAIIAVVELVHIVAPPL